jgi:formate-nitrite transporter family protein
LPVPEPNEIYEQTRREGRRRLSRPVLELGATALVGGFDVAFGIAVYGLTAAAVAPRAGEGVAHLAGAIAFGTSFVFIAVGRSELFTENFLVPITGLTRDRGTWIKLGELWAVSLVLNLVGGTLLAILLTSEGVLNAGAREEIIRLVDHVSGFSPSTAFYSGLVAGALMTLMTWLVEGAADSAGVRLVLAWLIGSILVLGTFNHAVVGTLEFVYGLRYDAQVDVADLFANLGISVVANLIGGLTLVTFARSAQALGSAG